MERSALSVLAAILRDLGIRWVLIGALAANRYRTSPRLTQDVDLLLADAGAGLDALEIAARAAGWEVRRASAEGDLLRLRHPELGIADLLIAGTEYQQEAIRRGREEPIGNGQSVRVLTAEDVIVHKLIAGRTQDRADIEAAHEASLGRVLASPRYLRRFLRGRTTSAAGIAARSSSNASRTSGGFRKTTTMDRLSIVEPAIASV